MAEESKLPIYASIGANVLIAATKLTAAAFTGSSAMVAEGVHSLVDSADGTLLLLGQHRSRRPPDEAHPFGYGPELYFWTLIVAILFFALGGGMSVYEGIQHIRRPEAISDPKWNYVVLGIAALFDGTSFVIAFREFRRQNVGRGLWASIRDSRDPSLFTVVLEDTADLVGLTIAFLGVFLGHWLHEPVLDGVASIGIGLVMAIVAVILIVQSKRLLIGEGATPAVVETIHRAAAADPTIATVNCLMTMHLGPHEILATLRVRFAATTPSSEIAGSLARLRQRVREAVPDVTRLFVETEPPAAAETPETLATAR